MYLPVDMYVNTARTLFYAANEAPCCNARRHWRCHSKQTAETRRWDFAILRRIDRSARRRVQRHAGAGADITVPKA